MPARTVHTADASPAPLRPRWGGTGPGMVVAAAFIGPGTVTTAMVVGASFGNALIWAVLVSVLVTYVLQEASARLTLASGLTLGEALGRLAPGRAGRGAAALLVLAAVVGGAAAFEAGNLLGAALAVGAVSGAHPGWTVVAAADAAFLLLWFGRPRIVERVLSVLVAVMAAGFLVNLALLPVDWRAVGRGLAPSLPAGAELAVVALVGTTVVPYNLFLHGSLARERGWGRGDLAAARADLALGVGFGGLLTAAIVIATASVLPGASPESAGEMARALEPLLGEWAVALFSVGLLAAAFTSAVTAPLAAAYAACHVLGWADGPRSPKFRAVWIGVLLAGVTVALLGVRPVAAIVAAQAANGVLLPLVAVALLAAVNRKRLVGEHRNGRAANLAGVLAVLVALLIGLRLITSLALGRV